MSEREIRAAIEHVCSDLELQRCRGILRPGAKAALYPMALGAAAIAAIACSAEPLLAEGGAVPQGGTGGTAGAGANTTTYTTSGGGAGTGAQGVGGHGADCPECANAGSGGMPGGGGGGGGGQPGGAGGG